MINTQIMKILFAVLGILFLVLIAFIIPSEGHLIQVLQENKQELQAFYFENKLLVSLLYIGTYIIITALSFPFATLLSLLGGAIFDFYLGVILTLIGSTIGATCAFLVSRFLLKDYIQKKYGDRIKLINEGVTKEGAFYLFSLQLAPIFPFFLVNFLMGLTSMKARTFYMVSHIGLLAGIIVYINAGVRLGDINTLRDIISPETTSALFLLATFPWIAKFVLKQLRSLLQKS